MRKPKIPTYIGEPMVKVTNFSFVTVIIIVAVIFAGFYFYDKYKKDKR